MNIGHFRKLAKISNSVKRAEARRKKTPLQRAKQRERRKRIERELTDKLESSLTYKTVKHVLEPYNNVAEGWVYFARSGECGPIKIGYSSTDVLRRLATLQTGHWELIRLVGVMIGCPKDETDLHKRFSKYRLMGEWFEPSDEVLEYVSRHPAGSPVQLVQGGNSMTVIDAVSGCVIGLKSHQEEVDVFIAENNGKPFMLMPTRKLLVNI